VLKRLAKVTTLRSDINRRCLSYPFATIPCQISVLCSEVGRGAHGTAPSNLEALHLRQGLVLRFSCQHHVEAVSSETTHACKFTCVVCLL